MNNTTIAQVLKTLDCGYKLPEPGSLNDKKHKQNGWLTLTKAYWKRGKLQVFTVKYRVNKKEYEEILKNI